MHSTPRTGRVCRRLQQKEVQHRNLRQATVVRSGWVENGRVLVQHALDGMVDVINIKCRTGGCSKRPSFGVAGTKTGEYCAQHALDGMVNVKYRNCRAEGCSRKPSFGLSHTKKAGYCVQHAPDRKSLSSSAAERSATPKLASSNRRSEWLGRKRQSTVCSTP